MIVEVVNPTSFVIPKKTKAVRDTMAAEAGTMVYMTDDATVYVSTTSAVGSTSWKAITMA